LARVVTPGAGCVAADDLVKIADAVKLAAGGAGDVEPLEGLVAGMVDESVVVFALST
jgi:hypothetical protein